MNLSSNNSTFDMPSTNLEKFISSKLLEKFDFINAQTSQNTDPLIKLLEDLKTRKIKVIIPSEYEINISQNGETQLKEKGSIRIHVKNKFFPIKKPIRFLNIFKNPRGAEFPTLGQKRILERLKKIPSYTVVTKKNELVMAMSRDIQGNNVLDWVKEKYYNTFVWTKDEGPISVGLFFMNKEDAQLYLHEIVAANPKMAEKAEIAVKMVGLDTFYRLNRTSPPGQQAKLIADLEEIEKVIQTYVPRKQILINSSQTYTKTGYKGTPIYKIKPAIIKNKNKEYETIPYQLKNREQFREYIFFNLKDTYSAWDKFCEDHKSAMGKLYPEVEIYNLEDYLNDLERRNPELIKETLFISPLKSFENLKLENELKTTLKDLTLSKKIKKVALEKWKDLYSFSKKILWVLTSDTLPTEKNAW